jgi:hypothetical protein
MMALFLFILLTNVALTFASPWIFSNWMWTGLFVAAVIALSVFVELLTKARIEEQARKLEFVG